MIVIKARALVSDRIAAFLQGNTKGEVLLCTSKGVYLRLAEQILLLTTGKYGCTPLGIGLESIQELAPLSLQEGQSVRASSGSIGFPAGVLTLKMVQKSSVPADPISLDPERVRHGAVLLGASDSLKGASPLCLPLLPGAEAAGALQNSPYGRVAYPLLKMLCQGLRTAREAEIRCAVRQLLGLGIGLTPSFDDVLLGMLCTFLRVVPKPAGADILKSAVAEWAPSCTNSISAAYLLAAADGEGFDILDGVLRGLAGRQPVDIKPMLEIGSSSGSEMLAGLLLAANIVLGEKACSTSS